MTALLLAGFVLLNTIALVAIAAWYRRDRADVLARATTAETEAANKGQVVAYLESALTDARGSIDGLMTERSQLARTNRRHYALPTIDGNKADILDAIDSLGIGIVLDCANPIDPPIAAQARGNVVVLDSKRGRA